MEHVRPDPLEAQFSSRLLNPFRHNLGRKPAEYQQSPKKEPELPPHSIIYNRNGNLANTTQLNQERADRFMLMTDLRRDVVIVDSDAPPERNAVAVSSNTLAFRLVEPIHKLTEVRFRPKPFHALVRRDNHFELQILERAMDDKIRSGHPIDASDYNEQFLKMLNSAVAAGASEIVTSEKLGISDQLVPYIVLGMSLITFVVQGAIYKEGIPPWVNLSFSLASNILWNVVIYIIPQDEVYMTNYPYTRRTQTECLLPLTFPLNRWVYGQYYLAQHGDKIIIPKPSQPPKSK